MSFKFTNELAKYLAKKSEMEAQGWVCKVETITTRSNSHFWLTCKLEG